MVGDPIVALLAKQSASRLREMRDEANAQLQDLQNQIAWIDRALAEKGHGVRSSNTAENSLHRPGRRRGSKRGVIKNVLGTEPEREWTPREIQTALAERGIDATVESVRVTLRRMLDNEGEVERGDHGWRFASANGSVQESLGEAQSSGSEG
jgi:hypothetical protein